MARSQIYQIFYNPQTKTQLDPGFLPLDNSANLRPDWYEFWPIRNFLLANPNLDENVLYGFVSPKFASKTGLRAEHIHAVTKQLTNDMDVVLFSPRWDQVAYFQNVFEQGDYWHAGLLDLSQQFFDQIDLRIQLREQVSFTGAAGFCNYFAAKPRFWREWLRIANAFFEMVENPQSELAQALAQHTDYGSSENQVPMKTFIQERFVSAILAQRQFSSFNIDLSNCVPVLEPLLESTSAIRRLLQSCDLLKHQFLLTGDQDFLTAFQKLRAQLKPSYEKMING